MAPAQGCFCYRGHGRASYSHPPKLAGSAAMHPCACTCTAADEQQALALLQQSNQGDASHVVGTGDAERAVLRIKQVGSCVQAVVQWHRAAFPL